MHIHLPPAPHGGQGSSSLPQPLQQPSSIFSYVLSTFTGLVARTAVTLGSLQHEPPRTAMPSMDATVLGFDIDNAHASESIETESGDFEIMLLDDLDMDRNHQPGACYRFSDLSNGASLDGIYIKKIYPNGHGYPCPNPCPAGRPVRIGDIGTLTSTGFIAIANLTDCQLPSLQSELASLALSDPLHDPNYFLEGHSITGGVSVENIEWPLLQIIRSIEYHCHAPQGAILAVTSPAQLHTLPPDRNDRLRAWLCKHGMDLVQFLDPGRTDSLYIVTGKVTSSSWATATYSEPMTSPDDVLVLARSFYGLPPYYWRKPRTARHWSKSSSAINPGGERASDQCLFLRGFLLTPSSKCPSREAHYALKTSNSIPGTRYPDIGTTGNASGEGSSQLDRSFHPSNQSGGSCEPLAGGEPNNSEQDDVLVEEVPSSRSVDFYPSHRINRRLLELTDADLAITHDDDWRFRLEGLHRNSMLGTRELEGVAARPSGHAGLNAGDMAPGKRLYEGDQISSMGKEEQGQVRLLQSSHRVKSTGSANVAGSDMTNHDVKMTEHSKEPRQLTTIPAKVSTTGEKNFELSMSSESGAQPEVRPLLHDQHVSSAQTQAPRSMTPEHTTTSSSPHRLDSEYVPPAFLSQAVPEASSLPSFDTLQSLSALESLPNHRTTHIEILGKATPRTGQWLLKWEKYWLWLESTGKLKIFWGVGTVGAGKTVLACVPPYLL
ncbi:hypothetical protein BKA70DRAFT_599158 [Coprinopsis sp. MPI-PUGE-AT-0042]|nr:hypothetical protein BKA70DRAFT_599158 [Coprinopsis sp. MPI-PUGE-AT-0042]